jgi:subtilisin family serine protease
MPVSLSCGIKELRGAAPSFGVSAEVADPEATGRYIVTFPPEASAETTKLLEDSAGLRVAHATDFTESAVSFDALTSADALVLSEVGVAVVTAEPGQMEKFGVEAPTKAGILAVEPERFVYALATPTIGPDEPDENDRPPAGPVPGGMELSPAAANYLRGYRDALIHLTDSLLGSGISVEAIGLQPTAFVETDFTWGLQATRAQLSSFTGKGIQVAVLDTGFDLNHPDFLNRPKVTSSFVPNQLVQDTHGHGTHCMGTACGPKTPALKPRYGIAYEASMFIGKVLSNEGSGTDGWILAGINWAVANRCPVVSMSLGRKANPGDAFPVAYEQAAQAGLTRGTLIVMAAGNESDRSHGVISPVGHPASCPSIMAVGAIDSAFRIANFSNRSINPNGGDVDIAGPGVAVRSSWPMPQRYNTISGTSMATPHVAGIAALYAQSSVSLRGLALWKKLVDTARNIVTIPVADDGAGLAQAP